MQTLRTLVASAWETDPDLNNPGRVDSVTGGPREKNAVWSKPDGRNHSFELYRLTTEKDKHQRQTEFYEFYWAHRVQGTTWQQVKSWIGDLMIRHPRRVPGHVMGVWLALWLLLILMALSLGVAQYLQNRPDLLTSAFWTAVGPALPYLSLVVSAITAWAIGSIFVKRVGDVVRYTNAKPENIATRQQIREAGVTLLEELSGGADGVDKSDYDRIIIVAHSLGCIVAYDVLTHAFARCNRKLDFAKVREAAEKAAEKRGEDDFVFEHQPALRAVEAQIRTAAARAREGKSPDLDLASFRDAQRAAQKELAAYGCPWLVTDFLTFGSPLAHAEFLIADGKEDLRETQVLRQYPTCPPLMEYSIAADDYYVTYGASGAGDPRYPHHAAMFAFTRWTNIYSPRRLILWGDIVSGTVAKVFGQPVKTASGEWTRVSGIQEIAVLPERDENGAPKTNHRVPWMTHNSYWKLTAKTGAPVDDKTSPPHHIKALRKSLNLLER
ncbi:hypothetical protein LCL97_19565 [Seohaeicola saemankumensis]|nr:hypothetical protein [Seohaeicola saemankumensis]MCA0873034.1 hypothetical protein [Seohaeicola saemankumensis]